MSNSSEDMAKGRENEEDGLRFPDAPDFHSRKPEVTIEQMIAFNEAWLPYFNAMPDLEERRLRTKSREPFKL